MRDTFKKFAENGQLTVEAVGTTPPDLWELKDAAGIENKGGALTSVSSTPPVLK